MNALRLQSSWRWQPWKTLGSVWKTFAKLKMRKMTLTKNPQCQLASHNSSGSTKCWLSKAADEIPSEKVSYQLPARGILCVKITCIVYLDHFYSSPYSSWSFCCCCCYCFYSWREKLSCWRINDCGNWVSHIKAHAWLNCIQFAHVTIMMIIIIIICQWDCAFAESETEIETETLQMFSLTEPFSGQAQEINELQKKIYYFL